MNYILGGPQKPDMMGMTVAEEQEAKKQLKKARKSFTDKERLTLMKSMSNKGVVATLPQKNQSEFFMVIRMRWFDRWSMWKVIF
jgi:hypothetical protein